MAHFYGRFSIFNQEGSDAWKSPACVIGLKERHADLQTAIQVNDTQNSEEITNSERSHLCDSNSEYSHDEKLETDATFPGKPVSESWVSDCNVAPRVNDEIRLKMRNDTTDSWRPAEVVSWTGKASGKYIITIIWPLELLKSGKAAIRTLTSTPMYKISL